MLTNLSPYLDLFDNYTELRNQQNTNISVAFLNGNNTANTRSLSGGVSARVYKNGAWGFASSPQTGDQGVKFVIEAATANAGFLDRKQNKKKPPLPNRP